MSLTWHDVGPVAELLQERYDTVDPRTVRLADLRKWVPDLEDFTGRPDEPDDAALEAIRAAWFDKWQAENG